MSRIRLYNELAVWWPLLSAPADYAEEADIFRQAIVANSASSPKTLLELGSGGGNNASHLKRHFELTLTDISQKMLNVSRKLNPECRHVRGDMRSIRLGERFDVVFIHDAISYMSSRKDLAQAVETAYVHCRSGGVALFVPDCTKESFKPSTSHGGHDAGDRALRYLEWTLDTDPDDEKYSTCMVYLLKDGASVTESRMEQHVLGLFAENVWLHIIEEVGFRPLKLPYDHSEFVPGTHYMYMGVKDGNPGLGPT